ncbi:hypothetical protein SYNPS1DRAFT_26248 [Syncephalis pseudoplumigaleata]|uniref:BCAS3 WD40 domain-containing protein n=1 Tax=Syncephalis pseudoplumigaleata TaxID=1712513 RepID=A0A4P9Z7I0_9FUNG|nr:hypothetical protein SYNPS1DRAFT_26248 [Syncephalis pseudoplumigaleata]|eukprot:RKP28162.1 hypothetical protein SYNPS1DRAFT_26248 [Syncephalis pseudoplumigaleata]
MRDHRRNQSTSSVSLPGSPKQLARSDSSGMGIRVEPRLARRFHDLSSFVSRHVNASVGNRSASPSLLVGSYPQTHHHHQHQSYRQRAHTAVGQYAVAHSAHRAIASQRPHRGGPWPTEAAGYGAANSMPSYADFHREALPEGDGKPPYAGPMYAHDMGHTTGKLPIAYGRFPMDNEEPVRGAAMFTDGRRVLRARFQALDQVAPIAHADAQATAASSTSAHGIGGRRRTALLLGYADGFHVWDVSNVNEIREMASVRGHGIGQVMDLQIIPEPSDLPGDQPSSHAAMGDTLGHARPLLAIVSAPAVESNWQESLPPPVFSSDGMDTAKGASEKLGGELSGRTVLIIYSLKTHQIVRKLTDPRADVVAVACNRQVIVMTLSDGRIRVVSNHDLSTVATFSDALITEEHPAPVFSLGSRWLAYACATPPPPAFAGVTRAADTDEGSPTTVEKVAREVMQGVKSLGSLGYKAMSDYLASRAHTNESPSPIHLAGTSRQRSRRSSSAKEIGGVIIVRDLVAEKLHATQNTFVHRADTWTGSMSAPSSSAQPILDTEPLGEKRSSGLGDAEDADTATSSTSSIKPIVHFRAHEHPCSALIFDPSGFRLVTVSSRGDTFRVHSVARGRAALLFTLSRGYTHATINDMVFDHESRWFAVSTGHGTTHVFRLPSVEAQQSSTGRIGTPAQQQGGSGSGGSGGGWSRRTALTDRAWPPVVRIRQKLDEDLVADDLSDALYSGPVTPSTSYSNGGGGHRTPHMGGGSNGAPLFDVTSVWANSGLGGGSVATEGDGAHTPPPPLAARFASFGPERSQVVFIINGSGLLTMHRLKRVKTTELTMEADDVAEWKLLRGEDWDTVMQPIQFTDPAPSTDDDSKGSANGDEADEEGEEEEEATSSSSANDDSDQPSSESTDAAAAAAEEPVPAAEPTSPTKQPAKMGKSARKKAKRRSKTQQSTSSATEAAAATVEPSTPAAPVAKTSPAEKGSTRIAALMQEASWLAHAEIVTYPPNYARVLWNQPGFQFQVFDPAARGDGGDLSATKPVDVNHPLPTPYGWARAENTSQEASGTDIEECIRKAMQSDMDLSPASRELLDAHNNRGSDPFARSQRHSPSALMQEHDEHDEEIVGMLGKQSPLLPHRHRSPLLTPEDLDHDTLDEFDLYDHDYAAHGTSHMHEPHRPAHDKELHASYGSGMATAPTATATATDDWQDAGHLRIPPVNSRGGSIHSLRQSTRSPHTMANSSGDATSASFMSGSSHPTASDVSIGLIMDDVREISLSDDDDSNNNNNNHDASSKSASNYLSQSPNTSGSRILGGLRWFDD